MALAAMPAAELAVVKRPHQEELVRATIRNIRSGKRVTVGDIFPASGKTFGWIASAAEALDANLIDSVVVLVPRMNLAEQGEEDWDRWKAILGMPDGWKVVHRENPQNGANLFRMTSTGFVNVGYIATYQAVVSRPEIHERELLGRRFLLVTDEAHQLGIDDEENGTESARVVSRLMDIAVHTLLLTGTAMRADGQPLVGVQYTEPDENGYRHLIADVRATYRAGVGHGYLREFDFTLVDGMATFEQADGRTIDYRFDTMTERLSLLLREPEIWQPCVDEAVKRVRAFQQIDGRLCGLIAAVDQNHAEQIEAYLRRQHPTVKALIAISRDANAKNNLKEFRKGQHDILITVAMAHIGFDHPPIIVVCALCAFRKWSWLIQLFARGLRKMADLDPGIQVMHGIAPNDPQMVELCNALRRDSQLGIKDREERQGASIDRKAPLPGVVTDAEVTGFRGFAFDHDNDLDDHEFEFIRAIQEEIGISTAVPVSKLKQFAQKMAGQRSSAGQAFGQRTNVATRTPKPKPVMSELEKEKRMSAALQNRFAYADRALGLEYGAAARACWYFHGAPLPNCGFDGLEDRTRWFWDIYLADHAELKDEMLEKERTGDFDRKVTRRRVSK